MLNSDIFCIQRVDGCMYITQSLSQAGLILVINLYVSKTNISMDHLSTVAHKYHGKSINLILHY